MLWLSLVAYLTSVPAVTDAPQHGFLTGNGHLPQAMQRTRACRLRTQSAGQGWLGSPPLNRQRPGRESARVRASSADFPAADFSAVGAHHL